MAANSSSQMCTGKGNIPILNISPIFYTTYELTNEPLKQQSLNKLVNDVKNAMENVGFMQITSPVFPSNLCKQLYRVQKEYFALPILEKTKIKMSPEYPYGYESNEILSMSFDESDEDQGHSRLFTNNINYKTDHKDFKETYQVCLSKKYISNAKIPKRPEMFGKVLSDYYDYMAELSFNLMELFALALDLPREFFNNKIDCHQSSLRLLNYPPVQNLDAESKYRSDRIKIRASEHSDYGICTILNQDSNGGLQIRRSQNLKRNSDWEDVAPLKEHFVVNIGDMMMRWTNDKWKSTVHRVVAKEENYTQTRQSAAFFFNANADALIETIESCCVNAKNKYKNVIAGEYLRMKSQSAMNNPVNESQMNTK